MAGGVGSEFSPEQHILVGGGRERLFSVSPCPPAKRVVKISAGKQQIAELGDDTGFVSNLIAASGRLKRKGESANE